MPSSMSSSRNSFSYLDRGGVDRAAGLCSACPLLDGRLTYLRTMLRMSCEVKCRTPMASIDVFYVR